MKIGLLIPQSNTYPRLSADFEAGLQMGLGKSGLPRETFTMLSEDVELGAERKLLEAKTRKLALQKEVNIIYSFAGNHGIELNDLAANTETLIWNVNMEASQRRPDLVPNPFFIEHRMGAWKSMWALGKHAATLGKTSVVVSGFYEAGYELVSAFNVGFEQAGGKMLYLGITKDTPTSENVPPLIEQIHTLKPDVVFFAFSGKNSARFFTMYRELCKHECPIFTSPYAAEDDLLASQGELTLHTWNALSWSLHLDNETNQTFTKSYLDTTGRKANTFAVLGYEAGCWLGETTKQHGELKGEDLAKALQAISITGPRGTIHFGANSATDSQHFLRQVQKGPDGLYNKVIAELKEPKDIETTMRAATGNVLAGWFNPYLCA